MPHLFDATKDLRDLATLAADPQAVDQLLSQALAGLHQLVPHDLVAVLQLDGNRLQVRAAQGSLASDEVRRHSLDLKNHPTIRRALENRRPLVLQESDHAGPEKDPYHGVVSLPDGHSCMVVPLYSGTETLGLMTFDRQVCGTYDQNVLYLADAYGRIISLALRFAEQAELLDRYRQLQEERNRVLSHDAGSAPQIVTMLERTRSPLMQDMIRQGRQVALTDAPVLITGETGTGKEVLAQGIHAWSNRQHQPFMSINCAAIPENLIESELFGHVKGAFTGAVQNRPGRFLAANGGTLLLDEIGDLPLAAQAKLLRVLQEGTLEAVGSDQTIKVDVRILAATHQDLDLMVSQGRFRQDLFYRLDVFPLVVPPLRERPEDLTLLAVEILDGIARRTGRGPWTLGPGAGQALARQQWPGNVRQLVNTLERATIFQPNGRLNSRFLEERTPPTAAGQERPTDQPEVWSLVEIERKHLKKALNKTRGKIYGPDGAAALLKMKPTTLQSRLKKLGIKRGSGLTPPPQK